MSTTTADVTRRFNASFGQLRVWLQAFDVQEVKIRGIMQLANTQVRSARPGTANVQHLTQIWAPAQQTSEGQYNSETHKVTVYNDTQDCPPELAAMITNHLILVEEFPSDLQWMTRKLADVKVRHLELVLYSNGHLMRDPAQREHLQDLESRFKITKFPDQLDEAIKRMMRICAKSPAERKVPSWNIQAEDEAMLADRRRNRAVLPPPPSPRITPPQPMEFEETPRIKQLSIITI